MSLASLSGAPPPGGRRSMQESGGSGAPLSSLSGAPTPGKPKATFVDDDDDFPTFSKTPRSASSNVRSSVRKSTPNPQTVRLDEDDDAFPKSSMKKTVSFAAAQKSGVKPSKSPFDDEEDLPRSSRSSTFKDPFGDEKPSTSRSASVNASTSSRPSASNPAFKWDDESPPRSSTSAGRASMQKPLVDDDFDAFDPANVFSSKKPDDSLSRSPATGVRASGPSRPMGPKADDIFGMMKDEPPPIAADLDLFGSSAASKPAAGPRAGRRAATQQSMTDFSPEISREPTPEPSRPGMSPEPSGTGRLNPEGSSFERSRSAPRGSYPGEDFGDAPSRSPASTATPGRGRGGETGPSVTTLVGPEASSTMSPPMASRVPRPSGGDGIGGMELDGDDLPGIGSPALLSKNTSSVSVHGPSTAAPPAGRRTAAAAPAKPRADDSWEIDDNLLPDESNSPPPPPLPPKSPPLASASSAASTSTPSSGYTPSAQGHAPSRLQHTTFGGPKKDDGNREEEEPSTGGYTPSFAPRRPAGASVLGASASYGVSALNPAASGDYPGAGLSGTALTPGGPGAPRPRRQLGSADTSPMASASFSGPGVGAAAKPAGPPAKKTKEDEERERVAAAMAAAQLRRQQMVASGPIRFPGQAGPAPAPAPASTPTSDAGVVPTPASPSPIRPGAGGRPGMGFGKKTVDLGLSSDSSDDDLMQPDKAVSPPLYQMTARNKSATSGHQPQRATTTTPLGREAYDSRVASSVPEMGAAAAAAALGAVPGPGPGSIVQSSAPAPPLHQEVSYPQSITSQPSGLNMGGATPPVAQYERSAASLASQPSGIGGGASTAPMGLPPGVAPTSPQHQQGLPPGVTPLIQQPSLTSGSSSMSPQQSLPPGVTTTAQQQGVPPGLTAMAQQNSLPPGVTAMSQQQSLPPGVTALSQQPSLPPGVTAMSQQQSIPPGVTAMSQQQSIPPGVTAMSQQQSIPPGVTAMSQQPSLPPGVTAMAQNLPPGVTAMEQQRSLPPGVSSLQQQQSLPPGVTAMAQQQGFPQGMPSSPPRQGVSSGTLQQQGFSPGMQQQQQGYPPGMQQQQGNSPGADPRQQQQGYPPDPRLQQQGYPPDPRLQQQGYSPDPRQQQQGHPPDPRQQQLLLLGSAPDFKQSPPQQRHPQQHHPQSAMSTAFALPPDSNTAAAISRAMPPHLLQTPHPAMLNYVNSLALPGSAAPPSPGELTLARIPMESLKETLVKSLQDELEKMSKQVNEVKAAYDKQLSDVRSEYERQLHDARSQHEKQVSDVRGMAERLVEEARMGHRKQMEDAHVNHERQLDDVRRRLERHVEEARAVQERQLAEARAQREKVIEDARMAQHKVLEDARGQHHKALEDTRSLHEKVLADTQAVHVKQVVELKNLYESELRRAAHDIGRAVDDTRRVAEEARRQEGEARRGKEEVMLLRDRILGMETELRARDAALRESETRLVQLDTRNKTELAETQANAIKEAALMKLEMEDAKAALGRVRLQYEDASMAHAQEIARYRAELDAQRIMGAEELQRSRLAAAEQIAAAEARGRRAGMLDKEIAEATIRQQMAAIAEEKEVVSRHRLSAELLAQLTEKVRAVAVSSIEREERALGAMERDVADREGRLSAREKLLGEREGRVALREREVDGLRADLQNLMVTLESSAVHDREDLKREQLRLSREAARIEAATSSLQAEREDLRVQITMEKRLLEEAREARRREREDLLTEVTAERRRLATEYADTQRQLDAARNELLAVRSRLVDLESRCNGAITQAAEEEKRLEALRIETTQTRKALDAESNQARQTLETEVAQTRQALQAEVTHTREALQAEVTQMRDALFEEVAHTRESLSGEVTHTREALQAEVMHTREALQEETGDAREALQEAKDAIMMKKANVDIEARELVEYAARLQAQSQELAAQAADAEARDSELSQAMESFNANQAALQAAQKDLEEHSVALEAFKKTLDRERLALAEERRSLSEERLAASRAADDARGEQLRLTEAVRSYVQQGIPIAFAVDGATGTLKPMPPPMPPPALPTATPDKQQSGKRRGSRPAGRSRNALKHVLDRLGVDAAMATIGSSPGAGTYGRGSRGGGGGGLPGSGGGRGSSYVRAQQEFLEKMRLSAPGGMSGMPMSAGHKLAPQPPAHSTSPIMPGLNPALLPPGLAATHARSAAATPVKHVSTLPLTLAEFDSERPSPAAPSFAAGLLDAAGVFDAPNAGSPDFLRSGGGGMGDMGYDRQPGPDGTFGSGTGTGVIQQLLDTIQLALKKSSRVSASKASETSTLEAMVRPHRHRRYSNRPPHRYEGDRRGGGGDGVPAPVPRLNLNLNATPYASAIGDGLQPTPEYEQGEGHVSSAIASLVPLSSSSGTSLDLVDPDTGGDQSDPLGALGPRLDALAEELSSSTGFGATPANTLAGRMPLGASLGSEDTFGGGGRLQQLGELAAMNDMLSARLEELGLGQMSRAASQAGLGGGTGATSVIASSNYSPRVGPPLITTTPGVESGAAAMSRQQSLRMSPPGATGPSVRSLLWGGGGPGSLARSLTPGHASAAAGEGPAGIGHGASARSAADTPLLGSANAEALVGMTLLRQQSSELSDGEPEEQPLSLIASVATISDDDDGGASALP